jgi:hypothetical protein
MSDNLLYNDWFEDGICLFCGKPAKETWHTDSRESSFSCYCEHRLKFNEIQREIKLLMKITDYHLNRVTLNKRLVNLQQEIHDNQIETEEILKLLAEGGRP